MAAIQIKYILGALILIAGCNGIDGRSKNALNVGEDPPPQEEQDEETTLVSAGDDTICPEEMNAEFETGTSTTCQPAAMSCEDLDGTDYVVPSCTKTYANANCANPARQVTIDDCDANMANVLHESLCLNAAGNPQAQNVCTDQRGRTMVNCNTYCMNIPGKVRGTCKKVMQMCGGFNAMIGYCDCT